MSITNKLSSPEFNYLVVCVSGTERVITTPPGASSALITPLYPVPVYVRVGPGAAIPDPVVEKLDGSGPVGISTYATLGPISVEAGDEIHILLTIADGTTYAVSSINVTIRWGIDDVARSAV